MSEQIDAESMVLHSRDLEIVRYLPLHGGNRRHTLTTGTWTVDGRAAHQNIVDDRKTALAPDIFTLSVQDTGIGEHSGFVEAKAAFVLFLGQWDLVRMEPIPDGPVDYLVRGMAEDIND